MSCDHVIFEADLLIRYYNYFWLADKGLVGPKVDNAKYPQIKPETWEDFMRRTKLEDLHGVLFGLASH